MDFWPKKGHIWPKTDILGQILACLAHLIPFPTKEQCRQVAQVVFLLYGYQNFYLLPQEIGFFGPKTAKFGLKLTFLAKYRHFLPIWSHARPKTMQRRCLGDLSIMRVPKLLLSPVKFRTFGPKTAKFCPKYAFLGTYRPCRLILCPVGWLVDGCVSRKTPIYFIL